METGFSLGSNLGDRLGTLSEARRRLLARPDARLLAASRVYETDPVDVEPEHRHLRFLNAVVIVESPLSAESWLEIAHEVEERLGRVRTEDQFAPRVIDVDILYSGNQYIDSGGLTVPHPRWAERRFVVQPLSEVRGDLVMPGSGQTVLEILEQLPKGDNMELFAEEW